MAMKLNLDFETFGVNKETHKDDFTDALEEFLEGQFCHWNIDAAFDWETLQIEDGYITMEFFLVF